MKIATTALVIFWYTTLVVASAPNGLLTQDDPVLVHEITDLPSFDGNGNDACWQNLSWQVIDQVWIPWGTTMTPADFSGRYKVAWSSNENLMYFLLEIDDDIESDAYVPGVTADIYNFDMFEVFIDENKSGGDHLGANATNAFAYHIFTKFPNSGETTTTSIVDDMGSDYRNHFPSFILRKEGTVATWEFSLIIYDDTYSPSNIEGSVVDLQVGKVLGLSIAYNDDDEPEVDPSMTQRDNFIGSVAVTQEAYNDHWMNADDFGALRLEESASPPIVIDGEKGSFNSSEVNIYPNPTEKKFAIEIDNNYFGNLNIKILDCTGLELLSSRSSKFEEFYQENFNIELAQGIYYVYIQAGANSFTERISVLN